jgi:glycosyltransferase involved in cell wall biosynthesis
MGPKISVIIPTYYRNDLLTEAIQSVLEQDYHPIELVVVDDSGEGNAEPVFEEYEAEIDQVIIREENGGWNAANATGIAASTGEYIQFLDDDDQLLEGKLSKTTEVLRENPAVGVSYCGVLRGDKHHYPKPEVRGDILEQAMRFSVFPLWTASMLIEREILEDCLPLPGTSEDDDLDVEIADSNLIIDLAKRTEFESVDEILVSYRHEYSRRWVGLRQFKKIKQNIAYQQTLYDQYPEIRRSVLAEWYEKQGTAYLNQPHWSLRAPLCFAKSLYYSEDGQVEKSGLAIASIFGRGGVNKVVHLRAIACTVVLPG